MNHVHQDKPLQRTFLSAFAGVLHLQIIELKRTATYLADVNFTEHYPDYFTATILEWKHLLKLDKYKNIIVSSLEFLVKEKRIKLYGFVIMSNHIHIVWQGLYGHKPAEVQLSFMKYTAQMILKDLRNEHPDILEQFRVKASDRKYQIWERNPLSVSLWNQAVFAQKMEYIHNNPVAAGLCQFASDYHYSSASFYQRADCRWRFLTHYRE